MDKGARRRFRAILPRHRFPFQGIAWKSVIRHIVSAA
jgi:hypothetical protein